MSGQDAAAAERERKDHNRAWVAALAAGLLVLVVFRGFGWSEWWTVGMLSLLMGAYLATARPSAHVSPDTKGDSVYYLGLLFTFASMVAALLEFTRQADAGGEGEIAGTMALVGNLGIALVTTIVGLAGRVVFSVFQASPGDVVADATHGLAAAIDDMKSNVVRGGQSMEDLVGHLKKSADELQATTDQIAGSADRAAATADRLNEYSEKVAETAGSLARGTTGFEASVTAMAEAASGFQARMEGAVRGIALLDGEVGGMRDALGRARGNVTALSEASQEARGGLSGVGKEVEEAVSAATASAATMRQDMARLQQEVAGIRNRTNADADAVSGVLADAVQSMRGSLDAFVGASEKLGETVGKAGRSFSALAAAVDDAESRVRSATAKKRSGKPDRSGEGRQTSLALEERREGLVSATGSRSRARPAPGRRGALSWPAAGLLAAPMRLGRRGGRRLLAAARGAWSRSFFASLSRLLGRRLLVAARGAWSLVRRLLSKRSRPRRV